MSAEKLNLQCATCGSSTDRAQARSLMPWAELEACCNVDWLDEGTALPHHDIWTRSSTMPLTGHRQHVKLYHPFAAAIGESFWLMFMPGAAALNGWAEAPQTIITSAFVHCHLDEIIRRAESWAWVLVARSEEHTSELQSPCNLVCRLLLEKKKQKNTQGTHGNDVARDSPR